MIGREKLTDRLINLRIDRSRDKRVRVKYREIQIDSR
jgi:hypothetical protein